MAKLDPTLWDEVDITLPSGLSARVKLHAQRAGVSPKALIEDIIRDALCEPASDMITDPGRS